MECLHGFLYFVKEGSVLSQKIGEYHTIFWNGRTYQRKITHHKVFGDIVRINGCYRKIRDGRVLDIINAKEVLKHGLR